MKDFDLSDTNINETDSPRIAWCAPCEGPTELDENGRCITCRDNGDPHDVEILVPEPIPPTSPRSIECRTCGADPGEFCRRDEDGVGYNHAARVEEHELEHGVVAARPRGRA